MAAGQMATARELGPDGWGSYKGPTMAPREALSPDERARLDDQLHLAAEQLRRLGARRVVLFGSLARGYGFGDSSDVDLAVEDLPAGTYWQAWRLAEQVLGGLQVDLIALERASGPLRRAIERDGVEL